MSNEGDQTTTITNMARPFLMAKNRLAKNRALQHKTKRIFL